MGNSINTNTSIEMTETKVVITLLYDWNYKVYGKHWKRNYEYPVELTGRLQNTFTYDASKSLEEQDKEIKKQMKKDISNRYREEAMNVFRFRDCDKEEEFGREKFKISNIREVTRWSSLEDFNYTV